MQYPNARLFIHSLLSNNRLSGAEAIAQCAYEFGLVPAGSIEPTSEAVDSPCQCMAALQNVLIKHCQEKEKQSPSQPCAVKEIWAAVEHCAQVYKKERATQSCQGDDDPSVYSECKKMAPVLFDILLQQIRRYP